MSIDDRILSTIHAMRIQHDRDGIWEKWWIDFLEQAAKTEQPDEAPQTFTAWLAAHNEAFNVAYREFNRALTVKPLLELVKVTKEEAFMSAMQTFSRYFYERSRKRESVEESGWVIELAASEPCNPQYWAGSSLWIPDHLKAIRFARRQDAHQAADFMLDGMKIRVCEHGWTVSLDHINDSMRRIATKAEKAFPDAADSDQRYGYITGWQEAVRCKGKDIEGQS
jgi:hypothetical protein